MTYRHSVLTVLGALLFLSGCNGSGTTYGTGKSHEEQTLKSMYNMLSLAPEKTPEIDYAARPDLVMPADKHALPQPGSAAEQAAANEQWPVSPEEKIATVRGQAPKPHYRSGQLPTEYLTSKKEGIRNSAGRQKNKRTKYGERRGSGFVQATQEDSTEDGISAEVARRRAQLAYSKGVKRKFLIEPPAEYREPAVTAKAGDLGVTDEEILKRQKAAKKERFGQDRRSLIPTE